MRSASWHRALVVGASSGIGEAIVRGLAADGVRVAAVARREELLAGLAAACGSDRVRVHRHDVHEVADVPALLERIVADLGGLDLLVYASGILGPSDPDVWDTKAGADVVAVDLVGAMAWIDAVAPRFAAAGTGTIVAVSSVAADRGRRGFVAYHAAKAGLDAYLEGVRHRVSRRGVAVVTVKPGPVDTAMSRGLERRPLLIGAQDAARRILVAARRGGGTYYVPWFWRPLMFALRNLPAVIFHRMDL